MLFYSINSGRYPIHYLSVSFDKDKIMLKQQRDLTDYIQYKFLKNFLEIFKKEVVAENVLANIEEFIKRNK